ncbi:MAG: Gldg family protein [Gemmataceae bacterium]
MSADPTLPPAAARPGVLVEFVRTERANSAYVLLVLAAAFLAGAVYYATQATKAGAAPETPAVDPLNPDAPPPPPAEVDNPKKGDYWFGCIGLGVGCLIAAGAGTTLLARVPPAGVAEQRSWTRGFVLVVGGLLGLTGFLLGMALLLKWNEGVVAAVQAYDTGGTATARAGARWLVMLVIGMIIAIGVVFLAIQPARAEERNNQTLRRLVYGGNLLLTTLLLFGSLLVLNVVFALKVPNMLDTTDSGFYTLSDATKTTVGTLTEPVTAYVILPDDGSREINDIRTLMFSAQEIGGGKFSPKFVSPVTDKAELQKLQEKYAKLDKTGVGVLLAVGEEGKRHEFIPINDLFKSDFAPGGGQKVSFVGEGMLVQKLRYLSDSEARPVVYFTQSNGELALAGGGGGEFTKKEREAGQLKTHLESFSLDVRPLEFKDGGKADVPADAKLVVVADPTTPLSDAAVKALKDFMGRPAPDGKKTGLLVLAEARPGVKDRKMAKTGLEGLLGEYNVRLGDQFIYSYPIAQAQLTPRDLTAAFVSGRDGPHPIILPFARYQAVEWTLGREVTPAATQGGPANVAPLMATYPQRPTWLEDELLDSPYQALNDILSNDTLRSKKRLTGSPRVVAVAVSEGGTPPNPMNPHAAAGGEQQPRAVVFANSEMFSDAAPRQRGGSPPVGHELMAASLDWLRGKPPMALGTTKLYTTFELPPGETLNSTRLYLLPIGLALLSIAGLGAGVWVIRRK